MSEYHRSYGEYSRLFYIKFKLRNEACSLCINHLHHRWHHHWLTFLIIIMSNIWDCCIKYFPCWMPWTVWDKSLIPGRNLGSEHEIKLCNCNLLWRSFFSDYSNCEDCLLASKHSKSSAAGSTEVGENFQVMEGSISSIPTWYKQGKCQSNFGLNFF